MSKKNDEYLNFNELCASTVSHDLVEKKWVAPFNDDDGEDRTDFDKLYNIIQIGAKIDDNRISSNDLLNDIKYLRDNRNADRMYIRACLRIVKNNFEYIKNKIQSVAQNKDKEYLDEINEVAIQDKGSFKNRSGLIRVERIIRPKSGKPFKSRRWVKGGSKLFENRLGESIVQSKINNVINKMGSISIEKITENDPIKAEIQKKNQTRISNNEYLQHTQIKDYKFLRVLNGEQVIGKSTNISDQYRSGSGNFNSNRKKLHKKIVNDYIGDQKDLKRLTKAKEGDKFVVFTGGGSASGKSTAVEAMVNNGMLDGNHLLIDSDLVKTYIPEYNISVALGNPSAARQNHEESSLLSSQIQNEALDAGYNIVFDGTMKNYKKYQELVQQAIAKGYKPIFVGVEVDLNIATQRAKSRAERTGRVIPEEIIEESHANFKNTYSSLVESYRDKATYITINNDDRPTLISTNDDKFKNDIGRIISNKGKHKLKSINIKSKKE